GPSGATARKYVSPARARNEVITGRRADYHRVTLNRQRTTEVIDWHRVTGDQRGLPGPSRSAPHIDIDRSRIGTSLVAESGSHHDRLAANAHRTAEVFTGSANQLRL